MISVKLHILTDVFPCDSRCQEKEKSSTAGMWNHPKEETDTKRESICPGS